MGARQFANFSRNWWLPGESFRWGSSGQRWSAEIWRSPQRHSRTEPSPPKSLAAKTTEPGSGSSISSRLPLRCTAISRTARSAASFPELSSNAPSTGSTARIGQGSFDAIATSITQLFDFSEEDDDPGAPAFFDYPPYDAGKSFFQVLARE